MMAVITTLRMRDWHPSKIWGQSGRAGSTSLAWGIASLLIVIGKVIAALAGQGASISFIQALMGFLYAALAYTSPMIAVAWLSFSFTHLGVIKK